MVRSQEDELLQYRESPPPRRGSESVNPDDQLAASRVREMMAPSLEGGLQEEYEPDTKPEPVAETSSECSGCRVLLREKTGLEVNQCTILGEGLRSCRNVSFR